MTAAEQYIYNCYLETSRKLNNKPFKYRKDFEGFEEKEEYILVSKLSRFFAKYSNIKSYTAYQNKFLPENPDHEQSIQKIKDSFIFLYNFCKDKGISFDEYTNYIDPDNKWHQFFIHLKNRNISLYPLFIFTDYDKILKGYDKEIKEFVFGDTFQNINFYRTKYYSSSKAKKLCVIIHEKLNLKLKSKVEI